MIADPRIVVASHNEGKVREIGELLGPFGLQPISAASLDLFEPEETGVTFAENALIKAHAAADASGLPALADDSGLEVFALGGEPGIYSARWAGPDRDFQLAMAAIEHQLAGKADRGARFVCALALVRPGEDDLVCEGEVRGALVWPPRGKNGFGYDPVFLPEGETRTFGEMPGAEKHAVSHRARAFAKLIAALK